MTTVYPDNDMLFPPYNLLIRELYNNEAQLKGGIKPRHIWTWVKNDKKKVDVKKKVQKKVIKAKKVMKVTTATKKTAKTAKTKVKKTRAKKAMKVKKAKKDQP